MSCHGSFSFSTFVCFLAIFEVLQCVSHFPRFSVFSQTRSYRVCFSFSIFVSVSRRIPCPTMWVSAFPFWSVFLPYSRSYSVQFSFLTFFSVSCHIPGHTVFLSHFPRYSVFHHNLGPRVCISHFSCFLLSPALFQVLQCVFLISHVFQFSWHILGPTMIFSSSSFVCFLTYSRFYSVCFSFSTFQLFLTIF